MGDIPRRAFLRRLGVGAGAALWLPGIGCAAPRGASRTTRMIPLYVGTYTRGDSRGIYRASMDAETGALTVDGVTPGIENPSFLTVDRARQHVYAVSEVGDFGGTDGGGVVAYAIERGGGLRELGRHPTHGGAPCHLALDRSGRWLLVANYSGGNASIFPVDEDGSLGPASQVVQHQGSGPDEQRQERPHAHNASFDPANRFAFVVDLGIDRVVGYRFDEQSGQLTPAGEAGVAAHPGAGPRHLAFHPDGARAYLINELDSTLTALAYDAASGSMRPTGTVSTLPASYSGQNSCADVHVHPSGRFVYGSNRGHDSIAVFSIDAGGGLSPLQHQATLGQTPRNFAIAPGGRFLVAANQGSSSLAIFDIDEGSGRLTPVGDPVSVPVPVCVKFL